MDKINYMSVVPDSQFYPELEMIKYNLEIMKNFYVPREIPNNPNEIWLNFPPITFDEVIKGIENTIKNGYKIEKNGKAKI